MCGEHSVQGGELTMRGTVLWNCSRYMRDVVNTIDVYLGIPISHM